MKFIRDQENFIKDIVQYWASKVTKVSKKIESLSTEDLVKAYMIPDKHYLDQVMSLQSEEHKENQMKQYEKGVNLLRDYTKEVIESFKKFNFYYNQYKHGLTIALRPFSSQMSRKEMLKRKESLYGYPICYDNESFDESIKKGKLPQGNIMIPDIDHSFRRHLIELQEEGNLLRYHMGHEVDIQELIAIGKKVCVLINILIKNRFDFVAPEHEGANTFIMPTDMRKHPFGAAVFTVVPHDKMLDLSYFKVEL